MEVYFLVLLISLIILYFSDKIDSTECNLKFKKIIIGTLNIKYLFFFIGLLPLILMSGLRNNIGLDYPSYVVAFKNLLAGRSMDDFEFGYVLINKIIALFGGNIATLFIVISIITLIPLIKVAKDNKIKIYYLVFCYVCLGFYCFSFNTVRQFIAISICLVSYNSIIEKKLIKYIFFVFLSMMFHLSAIIMLPFYFIFNYKYTKKQYFIIYCIFFFIRLISLPVKNILIKVFYPKYYGTFRMSYFENNYSTNFIIITFLLCLLLYFTNIYIKKNKWTEKNKPISNIDINIIFYCLLWSTTIGWLGEMGIRLSFYLRIFYVIIFASFLSAKYSDKNIFVVKFFLILFMILYFAYILYASVGSNNPFIPYESIASNMYFYGGLI